MGWIYLIIGGITEIVWAIGLKYSHGFTETVPSIVTIVFITISFYLFAKSLSMIPIGTAYAAFTGIGAAGTAIIGMIFLNEGTSIGKIFFLTLMIFGIIGLKLVSNDEPKAETEAS
ncbi:DMT family transporter [Metabacillus iocasae]|uniref:Quaternary ammonium compound-resistance protein SugE n=1 Tax=Priestia iocasae TaxID=2291674 RepID=A0ABS2QSG5_9BACI|nr:multidrug efflux SMR transporter [Metabacillus iocasae]MBM7702405.1 quaternary ammonium compound-resistance protein SugE [Metabacillus iocasae]